MAKPDFLLTLNPVPRGPSVLDRSFTLPSWRIAALTVAMVAWSTVNAHAESAGASGVEVAARDLAVIRRVQPDGVGHAEAQAAVARLSELPSTRVTDVLDAMGDASPLVKNWLRLVAASVAANGEFPQSQLLALLADRTRDPDARHAAFQMLTAHQSELTGQLLQGAETDPSLPLRHLAIARVLSRAQQEIEAGQTEAATESLRLVLAEGRNPDQLKSAASSLEKLGQAVDLAEELAMVRRWWAMGVFDNTDSAHFDTVYQPEATYLATGRLPKSWLEDGAAIEDASEQTVHLVTSEDTLGMVDLNPALDNAKDAIAYAYMELTLDPEAFGDADAMDAQARLGCINANKLWVNGQMVTANEVYHSGSRIDQYVGQCRLVPGINTVLVKVCQNAQTESWAQVWQFQFRFTDPSGAALRATPTSGTSE